MSHDATTCWCSPKGLCGSSILGSPLLQASSKVITSFALALNCSRAHRPALELLHISKSGGTSMCQLAKAAGLFNPNANVDANCMVRCRHDELLALSDLLTNICQTDW